MGVVGRHWGVITTVDKVCLECKQVFHSVPCHKRKYCSVPCRRKGVKGGWKNPHSIKWRRNRSLASIGPKHHSWKGGWYDKEETRIRHTAEYKYWRRHVFNRDDYTCQACGQRGGKLEADHELEFANYPSLRFEILNGRTLCVSCHRKTPNYGGRAIIKNLNIHYSA